MPFNGSGVYTPPAADFPVVTNTVISSTHFNNTINDIATGLTTCLTKDGQTTPTANIKLGGFKLVNVGSPTVAGDALVFGSAGTMTTLTATTSVVTPQIGSGTDVQFSVVNNNVITWGFMPSLNNNDIFPSGDNTQSIGRTSQRIKQVFTPIIDSGTTGSVSIKTNNGTLGLEVAHVTGTVVNNLRVFGSTTTTPILLQAIGTDSNISFQLSAKGTGSFDFTDDSGSKQFQVLRTASATRNITVTGSNGGNPTISTTAGSLAITPSVVIAGASLQVGTNPSGSNGLNIAYNAGALSSRNQANSGDVLILNVLTRNSVDNVIRIGSNASSTGVILLSRSGGAAPTTSDLGVGEFTVWRDTGGGTTKLYYNNAGAIQSVALA